MRQGLDTARSLQAAHPRQARSDITHSYIRPSGGLARRLRHRRDDARLLRPRWGELSGLRAGDVDLDRRRLEIRQTVVADKGYQRIEAPKDYGYRSIPIPAFLATMLARQIDGRSPDQPVFYGIRTGSWLRNHVFRVGWFDPSATAVGLGGLTPHEMRHTAASLAVSAGADIMVVQRMLGHASAAVTLDVYADLFDEDLDTVAIALDRIAMQKDVAVWLSLADFEPRRSIP